MADVGLVVLFEEGGALWRIHLPVVLLEAG